MAQSRSERRKERYKILIRLGFSAKEARQRRDWTGERIQRSIATRENQISDIPESRRSKSERDQLRKINNYNTKSSPVARQRRVKSRSERYADFSTWSKRFNKFPPSALKKIAEFNRAVGEESRDPYGFRRFYYWYVERISESESAAFADRADSPRRHSIGVALRSRRRL